MNKEQKNGIAKGTPRGWRSSWWLNILWTLLVPTLFSVTMEWCHRGTLLEDFWSTRFLPHLNAYGFAWTLLLALYVLLSQLTGRHWPAVLVTGLVTNLAGIVSWFKLEMRGEPLLPWDFSQIGDFMGVASNVKLQIQPPMVWTGLIFLAALVFSCLIRLPYSRARRWLWRLPLAAAGLAAACAVVFGVYLNEPVCERYGIYSDMWMQDRYYKNYGVVTGFLTNLRVMDIEEPENYTEEAVDSLARQVRRKAAVTGPLYEGSYAKTTRPEEREKQPNIIYVMNESFWDVSRLEGVAFDRELTPNLTKLKEEGAFGYCYSPSFGGGTCDVEFEALTGFSVEHLPFGSKPYQQYVTKDTFSLAQYLKGQGYSTLAIHGYYGRMWSRNTAYPRLGIDDFISLEDFVNPDKRRGFISDHAMTQRIIEEYEARDPSKPAFIHAVTMQNHTTYSADRYPADELVDVLEHPGFTSETISQLRDFATGVYEADAALGELIDYFRTVEEPTIIVFWGDHYNPLGTGYEVFEKTGYIGKGETGSPNLRKTDLLVWSNYCDSAVDLDTVAAYEISPVMMDLYGLDKPLLFQYLTDQLTVMRARTRGVTVNPDGTASEEMSEQQRQYYDSHWLLQYDQMFGEDYLHALA